MEYLWKVLYSFSLYNIHFMCYFRSSIMFEENDNSKKNRMFDLKEYLV